MSITNDGSYFEDFTVGDTLVHQRCRTITEADNHIFTSLVMNTAELHLDRATIDRNPGAYVGGKLLVYGGVRGVHGETLTSEDTTRTPIAEVEMDTASIPNPVFHGDTIYAESTVLEKRRDADRPDAGR